ncbi:hypothetical protein ACFL14_01755 [Patescibacteria group bacterium]
MEQEETFIGKKDELISLIRKSKLSDSEKEAWLHLLEDMLEHEIQEFIDILKDEEKNLQTLELKYQEKIKKIKTDFNEKWQDFMAKAENEIDRSHKNKIQQDEGEELEKLRQQLK